MANNCDKVKNFSLKAIKNTMLQKLCPWNDSIMQLVKSDHNKICHK